MIFEIYLTLHHLQIYFPLQKFQNLYLVLLLLRYFVNDGVSGQYILGTGYNYGIIANSGNTGQNIGSNGIGYNFGLIHNKGNYGQNIGSNGVGYNYGVIINTNNNSAQSIIGTGYNYILFLLYFEHYCYLYL